MNILTTASDITSAIDAGKEVYASLPASNGRSYIYRVYDAYRNHYGLYIAFDDTDREFSLGNARNTTDITAPKYVFTNEQL